MIRDFRDILSEFVKANVRFLVVGAHALSVHGVPRATVDLDIWVDATPENAKRVWAALAAFGAPLETLDVREADFVRPDMVAQFGVPPYRIDILTGVSGVSFEDAWAERVEDTFEDVRVPFLGRAAFVRNKRASGRKKDLADLELLGES
ncbi:MAG TPA: hypothetical protein VHE78_07240 [Gemmatimonadaceae bacterium]|nr:hypothetical protein [Gemmatimonadaceae bacterium]